MNISPADPEAGEVVIPALNDYREAKRQFEITYIKAKLREHAGNITRTAPPSVSTARASRKNCANWESLPDGGRCGSKH